MGNLFSLFVQFSLSIGQRPIGTNYVAIFPISFLPTKIRSDSDPTPPLPLARGCSSPQKKPQSPLAFPPLFPLCGPKSAGLGSTSPHPAPLFSPGRRGGRGKGDRERENGDLVRNCGMVLWPGGGVGYLLAVRDRVTTGHEFLVYIIY